MHYLIDTHIVLWAISDKKKLSDKVRVIIENADIKISVSQISLLEIAIELRIGKLYDYKVTLEQFIQSIYDTGFEILPLKNEHLIVYSTFRFDETHRDPFDRYLIATAVSENIALISKDDKFKSYSDLLQILW